MDQDRLSEILELLELGLEHPELDGTELAASAYLSRFHLDRIVRARLGEPLGTMRRRLLLERAAHELTTTGDPVIEVAARAGYTAPEAFTRAFSRAYGCPPSELRSRPETARHDLPSPNGIHLHPPGGLRFPDPVRGTSMDVLVAMYRHHVDTTRAIVDRLGSVSVEVLDAPVELSVEGIDRRPTLRSLAARLVSQLEMWIAAIEGATSVPRDADDTAAGLTTRLGAAEPRFTALVVDPIVDGQAGTTFVDAVCDPPRTFTLGGVLAHVLTFSAVRRTMAIGALETAGVDDLGSGDPMLAVGGEGEDASRITRRFVTG